jgi:hypothetical protein
MSKELFLKDPELKMVLATVDGHFFFERARNAAQMHARSAGGERPLTIHEISREQAMGKEAPKAQAGVPADDDPAEKVLLDKALETGVVIKAGAFFKFGDKSLGQGMKKALENLLGDESLKTAIAAEIEKLNV